MAYLTFEEYVAFGGDLSEIAFPAAEMRARKQIDKLTASRVAAMETVPEEVKLSMMELIKSNAAADQLAVIQSSAAAAVSDLLYGVCDDNGTPLLYRGLDL